MRQEQPPRIPQGGVFSTLNFLPTNRPHPNFDPAHIHGSAFVAGPALGHYPAPGHNPAHIHGHTFVAFGHNPALGLAPASGPILTNPRAMRGANQRCPHTNIPLLLALPILRDIPVGQHFAARLIFLPSHFHPSYPQAES